MAFAHSLPRHVDKINRRLDIHRPIADDNAGIRFPFNAGRNAKPEVVMPGAAHALQRVDHVWLNAVKSTGMQRFNRDTI